MTYKNLFLNIVLIAVIYDTNGLLRNVLPDAGLTTEEHVTKYGYPFENHFVTTADGYILRAHRIPHGKSNRTGNKPSILLMPGLLRSSEVWVSFGPQRSLGFILADAGFDVWIGNYRGTTWSRRHVILDPDQNVKQFWNYSLDELGYYDCPAFIDYILQTTRQKSITYVGETVGASMFFIMASEKPIYNEKVKLMVAIAPIVDVGKAPSLIYSTVATYKNQMQALADNFGKYELLRHIKWTNSLGNLACADLILRNVCEIIHSFGVGFDSPQLNKTAIPQLLNGFPAGASLKELIHISQIYKTGVFAKYDYGKKENYKRYDSSTSPVYNLSKVTAPVLIYYGGNDILVDQKGVERVAAMLNNVISKNLIKNFNNGDFLWAKDVVKLMYNDMIKLLRSYNTLE